MPFVETDSTAAYPEQAQPDSADFAVPIAAIAGDGVDSGCGVTAQATPNMTVAVAAGILSSTDADGRTVVVTAGNVAVTSTTLPRRGLIVASNMTGALSVIYGTAEPAPLQPVPSASNIVLASVYIGATGTTTGTSITASQITDKRIITNRRFTDAVDFAGTPTPDQVPTYTVLGWVVQDVPFHTKFPLFITGSAYQAWVAPAATTEFLNVTHKRHQFQANPYKECRITAYVDPATPGTASQALRLQFSRDGGTSWSAMDLGSGPSVTLTPGGPRESTWVTLEPLARNDLLLRAVCVNGDGATSVNFASVAVEFRRAV